MTTNILNNDGALEIENIQVFIRIRPLSAEEEKNGRRNIVLVDENKGLIALNKDSNVPNPFKFDQVFSENAMQFTIYQSVAFPIVDKSLRGYNGTIFAYGQTGTGKTYTMSGNMEQNQDKGVIMNTFLHVFDYISRSSGEKSFVVIATYLQLYNEEVYDLLSKNPNQKLIIKEKPDSGIFVKDLTRFTVDSVEAITKLFNKGNRHRVIKATAINDVSSRSHTIFTISIESRSHNTTTISQLNLVDLAGCERASRTNVNSSRLKEASNINLSLSALGNVISALVDGKSTHIPYRNSKLTRLLQNSLGGNSKTAMIAMISPSDIDYEESMRTLRYAARVKCIKNRAKINIEPKGLIEAFEQEIAELEQKISYLTSEKVLQCQTNRDHSICESKSEEFRKYDEELQKVEAEKTELLEKISDLQKNILVGGENLIEKVQYQARLLESSYAEIDNFDKMHSRMEEMLNQKGQERIDIEEKYSNLQEEDEGLSAKIKQVQDSLNEARKQYEQNECTYQKEKSSLEYQYRCMLKEIELIDLVIGNYIPKNDLDKITENIKWNEETQEYQLEGIAYAGNNLRDLRDDSYDPVKFKFKAAYQKYPKK